MANRLKAKTASVFLPSQPTSGKPLSEYSAAIALILGLCLCVLIFLGGLGPMTASWHTEEYSHAYLIPFISLFLFAQKTSLLSQESPRHQARGIPIVILGILLLIMGELSSLPTLIQYGFLTSVGGLLITLMGTNGYKLVWVAHVYLIFMIPLPTLIQNILSHNLQLISSSIGVAIVRWFDISVFREGNVIDLGQLKLQVVDACSGLRYLFPLMSFGFLLAALYRAPIWQKALIFLSTIPITILMNSVRIGVVGVTVEHFGISAAEGFLHYFEGWIIFILCIACLLLEMQLIRWIVREKSSLVDLLEISTPSFKEFISDLASIGTFSRAYVISIVILLLLLPMVYLYGQRMDSVPQRQAFATMPLIHKGWFGRERTLDQNILENLKLTDYFYADFTGDRLKPAVNLYIAYYDSQKKGAGIHSPKSCIPGGGWEIQRFEKFEMKGVPVSSRSGEFIVNRVIVQKGDVRSVVYYWFQQHGRIVNDEYLNRWYVFVDSVMSNRSDGALVRLNLQWLPGTELATIDEQASAFVKDFYPLFSSHLPD